MCTRLWNYAKQVFYTEYTETTQRHYIPPLLPIPLTSPVSDVRWGRRVTTCATPQMPYTAHTIDQKTNKEAEIELMWSPSGSLLFYQLGIMKFIMEEYHAQNPDLFNRRVRLAGISGGAIAATVMTFSMYGYGTIDYWFERCLDVVRRIKRHYLGPFFVTVRYTWHSTYNSYKTCLDAGLEPKILNDRLRIFSTSTCKHLHKFREFPNEKALADIISSSSYIPFVTGPLITYKTHHGKYLDGCFSRSQYVQHRKPKSIKKCIVFDIEHEHAIKDKDYVHNMFYEPPGCKTYWGFIKQQMRIFSSTEYATMAFTQGYIWALEHKNDFDKHFLYETIP